MSPTFSNLLIINQIEKVVEVDGFEPTTSCMPCKRSSQLSYTPISATEEAPVFVGANINGFSHFAKFMATQIFLIDYILSLINFLNQS